MFQMTETDRASRTLEDELRDSIFLAEQMGFVATAAAMRDVLSELLYGTLPTHKQRDSPKANQKGATPLKLAKLVLESNSPIAETTRKSFGKENKSEYQRQDCEFVGQHFGARQVQRVRLV